MKQQNKGNFTMPQMDLYIGMSQVFWFTVIFIIFYLLIVQNLLPQIAQSIKLRKKKVGGASSASFDDEALSVSETTAKTLEGSLKDSQVLLSSISNESSEWLKTYVNKSNEETLLTLNKNYVKILGELKGRSFLIEEVMKKK
jgi:F0F1-type ATP synthase membrane subunit b/b'